MIKVVNVNKKIGNKPILSNISFELKKGDVMGIIGKSGGGKTTLAYVVSNILKEDDGEIIVNNKSKNSYSLKEYSRLVSIVFQEYSTCLNPKMKVFEILNEVFEMRNEIIDETKVLEVLKIVNLENIDRNRVSEKLSGGEKQRLNIARALLMDTDIYILDEVISSLDINLQFQVLNILKDLNKRGKTIIFITHNIEILNYLTNNIWEMSNGKLVKL